MLKLKDDDFRDLAFCTFRYALGRHTYIVGTVVGLLIRYVDDIGENTRALMAKEIKEELKSEYAYKCDNDEWLRLLKVLER